ncbi:MAG: 30S ribosomal protein S3 [Candidatus Wildermuthbacteria bacterium RIFCSPHIGHO2_02_FULL_47_12]|uniref:Small ribosomal subunit protein uS3 n=1 Tax=Candidatus Wildermuthbacteria bacterium RIFCSPHIGHO2_02_FULL_47_12 TaxID=1802451 RepID=A0A1G2R4X9_9BACT|nr:MAG: 30S ribosomal protein S3 [Candidatus Wildermuthbacteria bacterium RIFCSPHIGHO2_02_FULL_47_12]
MAHKVHPKAFRIKETKDWSSRWIEKKNYAKTLQEDFMIREFLLKKLKEASVESVDIERILGKIMVIVTSGRPGLIIGRGGAGIEILRKAIEGLVGKTKAKEVRLEVREIKNPWESATLTAQFVAQQLEKRMPARRVLKQTLQKVMATKGIEGVKVEIAGRLGGAEIARREWLKQGRLPLATLRAKIDYGFAEALTTFGTIGVKVWIFKGEEFE